MDKFLALAEQIIPLLMTAGMQLSPLISIIAGSVARDPVTGDTQPPTDAQWNALHDLRAQALQKINDTHGDRR